jgi:hypothetical protein
MPKHHIMNMYGGMEVKYHAFITPALNGYDFVAKLADRLKDQSKLRIHCFSVTMWYIR